MGIIAPLIMIGLIAALIIGILKFDLIKKVFLFLAFGLIISVIMIMIGRIWLPNLSAWWILVVEGALILALYLKTILYE